MKEIILSILKVLIAILLSLGFFSCSKQKDNLNDLNETIMVRHKKADLPVHIHGNASKKTFLIILHGGPGVGGLVNRINTIRSEIEKNFAVVYFDQRGSGNAQGSYSKKDLTLDLMVEDVFAVAKVLRSKYGDDIKLFLMGHSWGGTLGTATILKNQHKFSGWIEVDGAHNLRGSFDEYKIILPKTANEQIALGNSVNFWRNLLNEVHNTDPNFSVENILKLNSLSIKAEQTLTEDQIINNRDRELGDNPHVNNGMLVRWNLRKTGKILDYQEKINEINFTNRLSEITIPSLVLWGKHDVVTPLVFAHEAFDNLGSIDKEIYIFEKSGHSPQIAEPELFAEKVIAFINKHI